MVSLFIFIAALFFAVPAADAEIVQSEETYSFHEVPVYDFDWEDDEQEYDEICELTEYQKPSAFKVWLRSVGGAVYVGLCSAREYVVTKWYALRKIFTSRKIKRSHPKSSMRESD